MNATKLVPKYQIGDLVYVVNIEWGDSIGSIAGPFFITDIRLSHPKIGDFKYSIKGFTDSERGVEISGTDKIICFSLVEAIDKFREFNTRILKDNILLSESEIAELTLGKTSDTGKPKDSTRKIEL